MQTEPRIDNEFKGIGSRGMNTSDENKGNEIKE
jgi:hypothetical protein